MSYDIAVWEGDRPADDAAAVQCFRNLYDQYMGTNEQAPPTRAIVAFVAALLQRWPDLSEDAEDLSPWSADPLIGEARGPLIYFPMRYSMAEEASDYAAQVATAMSLTCFDPQEMRLRS
ncbi:hypothetical protein AB0C81_26860 [Streptomyces roseoverticillatus]|uniref:hypothetical protein n=1 Tax=Streptomyces roseoverticillatus TaxID=66429 RepID=UPI0033D14B8E